MYFFYLSFSSRLKLRILLIIRVFMCGKLQYSQRSLLAICFWALNILLYLLLVTSNFFETYPWELWFESRSSTRERLRKKDSFALRVLIHLFSNLKCFIFTLSYFFTLGYNIGAYTGRNRVSTVDPIKMMIRATRFGSALLYM